jgi:hypothetical protein
MTYAAAILSPPRDLECDAEDVVLQLDFRSLLSQAALFINGCDHLAIPNIAKVALLSAIRKRLRAKCGDALALFPAHTLVNNAIRAFLA